MPSLDFSAIPYNGQQVGELVFAPVVARPAIDSTFDVISGLKGKQVSYQIGRISKVTKKDAGCGTGKSTISAGVTAKYWEPNDMKVWISECWKNFRGAALEWKFKTLNEKSDLTRTDIEMYLLELLKDAVFADLWRMAWFGKKTIAASELTNGSTDVPFYDGFNGIFTQVFTGVAANKIKRVSIAENANTTVATQVFTNPGDVYPYFRNIFNAATTELNNIPQTNWQFFVTRSMFTAYLNYRESQNLDNSFTIQGSGVTNLTFRGVPITVIDEWDRIIQGDFLKSGKYDLPIRALLTAKGNFQLGFDEQPMNLGTESPFETWYNLDTEEWNARLKYAADSKIYDEKLIVAAY